MSKTVFIQDNLQLSDIVNANKNSIILCDDNSLKYCLPLINFYSPIPVIRTNAGEKSKSLETMNYVWDKMLSISADRNSVLVNIGGGVVTDIGGFAAAVYNRGIKFIHIPTTLMGMVDAANGGKTGINFKGLKNYLGTFSEPESVLIWPEFLKTLPFDEVLSGFAEMIKHGLISDRTYFEQLAGIRLNTDSVNDIDWLPLIQRSEAIKSSIVASDFKETGQRKLLNFGHTIGHALESFFMKEHLAHGYCIAAGMICEAWLSNKYGSLDMHSMQKIISVIDGVFARIPLKPQDIEAIIGIAMKDKKRSNKKIGCIYLTEIGKSTFGNAIDAKNVKESLEYYLQASKG